MVLGGLGARCCRWWSGAMCAGAVGLAVHGDDEGVVDERSMVAAATTSSSPRVSPHRENARFEITTTDPVS